MAVETSHRVEAGAAEGRCRDRTLQVGAAAVVVAQTAHDPARLAPHHEVRRRRCRVLASTAARASALACGRGGHRGCYRCRCVHLHVEAVGDLAGKAALKCAIHSDASRLKQRPNGCAACAVPRPDKQFAELDAPCRSPECGLRRRRGSIYGRSGAQLRRRRRKWRGLKRVAVLLRCRLHVGSASATPLEHVSGGLVHATSALASRESVTAHS